MPHCKVFITGSFRTDVKAASDVRDELIEAGVSAFVPTRLVYGVTAHDADGEACIDRRWLESCDAILAISRRDKLSKGDLDYAYECGVQWFTCLEQVLEYCKDQ